MIKKFLIFVLLLIPILFGCSDKFDINQLGDIHGAGNPSGDTVYVHINPDWSEAGGKPFNNPQAILVGKEPFIYVCDTGNDRIVMLNTAGATLGVLELSPLGIKKPIAIAQDYRLNLIVCAQIDTGTIPYSAVFKINLFALNYVIANAKLSDNTIKLILPRKEDTDLHPNVTYSAVTAFYNNSYYIARTGINNKSSYDPDNAIIIFTCVTPNSDSWQGTLPEIGALNSGLITANGINCMTSFNKKNLDFIATFDKGVENETVFKAQWFQYFETQTSLYRSPLNPSDGMAFVQPNKFGAPTGSCIDPSGNIYIADGEKDSVFKFSSFGDELQSFGGNKPGEDFFPKQPSQPSGVAFFDRTLYVLDSKQNLIIRFILSTDLSH
jgi:hypothetical protein